MGIANGFSLKNSTRNDSVIHFVSVVSGQETIAAGFFSIYAVVRVTTRTRVAHSFIDKPSPTVASSSSQTGSTTQLAITAAVRCIRRNCTGGIAVSEIQSVTLSNSIVPFHWQTLQNKWILRKNLKKLESNFLNAFTFEYILLCNDKSLGIERKKGPFVASLVLLLLHTGRIMLLSGL